MRLVSTPLRDATPQRYDRRLVVLLGGMIAMSAAAIDIGIPATPLVAGALGVSATESQFLISVYLAGFALGQIPFGWLGDRFGRRSTTIAALAVFCALGILCAFASSFAVMIGARLLQGFVGASGPVLSRAIARDLSKDGDSSKLMSTLIASLGLAPLLAPLIGAALIELGGGWRAPYLAVGLYGLVLLLCATAWLPETKPEHLAMRPIGGLARAVLSDAVFLSSAAAMSLSHAGYMAVVTSSSTILHTYYGAGAGQIALLFACAAGGYFAGSLICRHFARSMMDRRILWAGFALLCLAIVALAAAGDRSLVVLWGGICAYTLGHGIIAPLLSAQALYGQGGNASFAAGVMGAMQLGLSFCVSIIAAIVSVHGPASLGLLVSICGALALIVWLRQAVARQ